MKRVLVGLVALALLTSTAAAQDAPDAAERLAREGVEARRAGRVEEAVERLSRSAALDPENADTQVQLGLALATARRFEDARRAFRRALERAPGYDDARIGLARTYFFEERFDEAERELRALAERSRESAEARELAAQVARAKAAAQAARAPARSEPAQPAPSARSVGSPAADDAAEERRKVGAEVERLAREAREARDRGQAARAVDLLTRAARLQPENADVQVQLGAALIARGRFAEAGEAFRKALAEAPNYADARIGLARLAFFRKDYEAAERDLARVLEGTPGNADARALRDQVRRARREAAAAREREAAARRLERASALRRAGRFREAEAIYRAALRARPDDVDLLVNAGTVAAFQGPTRFADARRDLERALTLAPTSSDARIGLARLDLFEANLVSAQARLDEVLATAPNNIEALALLARVRLAQGEAEVAEALFQRLLVRSPNDPDLLTGLGDALRGQFRDEEALDAYRQASGLDPASADIRSRLALRPRPRWRLDLDGAFSRLTDGNEPWREASIRLAYQLSARTVLSGGAEASQRFGRRDILLDGRVDHRWTDNLSTYLRLGGTPQAEFRPRFLAEGGGALRLWTGSGFLGPTLATLDAGYARYPGAEVQSISPGLQQYLFDGRVWLTAKAIGTLSENTDAQVRALAINAGIFRGDVQRLGGYLLRLDALLTDRITAFVGYADAPDASDGRVFQTRSLFGGLELALDERVSIRVSGSREDRKNSYDRTSVGLGLTTRF